MLAFAALAGLQGPRALRNLLGQHQELDGRVRVAVLDAPAAELIMAVAAHAQPHVNVLWRRLSRKKPSRAKGVRADSKASEQEF